MKDQKNNSRRSALRKIAASTGMILAMPLTNVVWAAGSSGKLEGSKSSGIVDPLAMPTTTCAFVTTVSSTTTSGFTTPPPTTTSSFTTPPPTTTSSFTTPPPTTTSGSTTPSPTTTTSSGNG